MRNRLYIVTDMLTGKQTGYIRESDAIATGLPVVTYFRKHVLRKNYFQKIADMLTDNPDKQANADMLTDMLTASYRHTDRSEWYSPEKQSNIITALVRISGYSVQKLSKRLKSTDFDSIKNGKIPIAKEKWVKLCYFAFHQCGFYKNGKNDRDRQLIKIDRKISPKRRVELGKIGMQSRWSKYEASKMSNAEFRKIIHAYQQTEIAERLGITLARVRSYARLKQSARVPDIVAEKLLQIVEEDQLKRNSVISIRLEHPDLF